MTNVKVAKIFQDDFFRHSRQTSVLRLLEINSWKIFSWEKGKLQVCSEGIRAKSYREIFQNDITQVHGRFLKKALH